MSALTAVVLSALGAYVLAMIGGQVPTDFALFLLICTAVSGAYFAAEAWFFAPGRREQTVRAVTYALTLRCACTRPVARHSHCAPAPS